MYFYIAHIHCYDPDTEEEVVLRVTNNTHYVNGNDTYWPHLRNVLNFEESLFSRGSTSGEASVGVGEIILENSDGAWDHVRKFAFDGRPVQVYRLAEETDTPTDSRLFFTGVAVYAQPSTSQLSIYVKNRLETLSPLIQPSTFAGTNQGYLGLEGTEADLKGKTKPMLWGTCLNVPLVPVNKIQQMYACNYNKDGNRISVEKFFNVADKGGALRYAGNCEELGVDYGGIAGSLYDAVVPAGFYMTCVAEGVIKVGSTPKGDLTADVAEKLGEDSSAPRVVKRILEDVYGEVAGVTFNDTELEALHALNMTACGYYVDVEVEGLEVINDLLSSIGGWMVPDRLGVFRFGRFDLPGDLEPVVATFDENTIVKGSFTRIPTGDQGYGIPAKSYTLFHSKLWKVLNKNETIVSIGDTLREYYSQEFRSVTKESPGMLEMHPLAPDLSEESLMVVLPPLKLSPFLEQDAGGPPTTWDDVGSGPSIVLTDNYVEYYPPSGIMIPTYMAYSFGLVNGTGFNQLDSQVEEIWNGLFTLYFEYAGAFEANPAMAMYYGVSTEHTMKDPDGDPLVITPVVGLNSVDFMYDADQPDYAWVLAVGGISFSVGFNEGKVTFGKFSIVPKVLGLTPEEEAERRRLIYSANLARYNIEVPMSEGLFVELGEVVLLKFPRFGLEDGLKLRVIGKDVMADEHKVAFDIIGEE